MRRNNWLLFVAVAGIVVAIVVFVVAMREPMPQTAGTAPSVITGTTQGEPITAPAPGADPREVEASAAAGRGARGSGIEGLSSGGVTTDPPSGGK